MKVIISVTCDVTSRNTNYDLEENAGAVAHDLAQAIKGVLDFNQASGIIELYVNNPDLRVEVLGTDIEALLLLGG
jgi:hypothetical protein